MFQNLPQEFWKKKKEDQALKFDNEDLKLCYLQCLQILVR